MAFSNQHLEVCRGLPTHSDTSQKAFTDRGAHLLQPCDDMVFFLCSCTGTEYHVLLLEGPFFHAPCASTRQSLDRPYFYF